jgi:hypothetical protein
MSYLDPATMFDKYEQERKIADERQQSMTDNKFIESVKLALTDERVWKFGNYPGNSGCFLQNGDVHINKSGVSQQILDDNIALARSKGWIVSICDYSVVIAFKKN